MRAACVDCGAVMGTRSRGRAERCRPCSQAHVRAMAHERDQLLERLWNEGKTYPEIRDVLGLGANSDISPYLVRARAAGYNLPYRYRNGRKFPEEVAA